MVTWYVFSCFGIYCTKKNPATLLICLANFRFRYLVASRDIEQGELIFSEDPLAIGPNHNSLPMCLECMRPASSFYNIGPLEEKLWPD
jgi:hypothetical protein